MPSYESFFLKLHHYPDLAHNFTNSCRVKTVGACGVPRSRRLRDTTIPTLEDSKRSSGLTTAWDDAPTGKATRFSNFSYKLAKRYGFENIGIQKETAQLGLTFSGFNIHTGRYVGSTLQSETQSCQAARF